MSSQSHPSDIVVSAPSPKKKFKRKIITSAPDCHDNEFGIDDAAAVIDLTPQSRSSDIRMSPPASPLVPRKKARRRHVDYFESDAEANNSDDSDFESDDE